MKIGMVERKTVETCKKLLQQAGQPVAITGAGISVASGLPTGSGEWQGIELRDFFTLDMFLHSTERFYRYYRHMLRHWKQAKPNPAHYALARHGMPIITQNIDGLHQRAGSPHVLELHGNLRELVCRGCAAIFSSDLVYTESIPKCPSCGHLLKPDIVLVGEDVYHFATAVDWVGKADLLLVVGTRLEMEPCRQLPEIARRNGAPVFTLNRHAEQILPIIVCELSDSKR
ncbi:SIR2 family NAD-dependent protein deacylase [Effusibacillus pohliae]|uniref:SIR2 family NAD-dependent protein deacylase n=1 Tax=Effusibacillus pohliae TaxID=232270 RepID=UPI00036A81A0|nr:Sir2 family NAD-dependent protein deacetylase [Effusibacillus pohliae]